MNIIHIEKYSSSSFIPVLLGGVEFAVNYPLASCVGHFIVTSSGSMVANLLLGNTLLVSVTLPHVVIAISVW